MYTTAPAVTLPREETTRTIPAGESFGEESQATLQFLNSPSTLFLSVAELNAF